MQMIDNLDLPELQLFSALSENQLYHFFEPEPGLFIAEGAKVILRALDAGYAPYSLLAECDTTGGFHPNVKEVIDRMGDVPVYTATLDVLESLVGYHLTGGLICAMRRRTLSSPEALCKCAHRVVVLENVTNPTNVGAIFRSAAALSMDGVLLTHTSSDPLYRRAARVSMGTAFQVPWTVLPKRTTYPTDILSLLKQNGFQTVALALTDDSVSIDDEVLKKAEKLALFFGAEGDGLSQETIASCDYVARIPMAPGVDSLNVAAASAVAFWELRNHPSPSGRMIRS